MLVISIYWLGQFFKEKKWWKLTSELLTGLSINKIKKLVWKIEDIEIKDTLTRDNKHVLRMEISYDDNYSEKLRRVLKG